MSPKRYYSALLSVLIIGTALTSGFHYGGNSGLPYFVHTPPQEESWYPSIYNGEILDQDIFLYDIGNISAQLRKADILVLGSSRVGMGLHWKLLHTFSEQHKTRIYNMSFASAGSVDLSLDLIRKYDLKPKLIIACADNDKAATFFSKGYTEHTTHIRNEGERKRRKYIAARNISFWLSQYIKYLPPSVLPFLGLPDTRPWQLMYRSIETGNWYCSYFKQMNDSGPAKVTNGSYGYGTHTYTHGGDFEKAKQFLNEINSRGAQVILTAIPHNSLCGEDVKRMASGLNLELIMPEVEGLILGDGSHLSEESARRFTEAWLKVLKQSKSFKTLLNTSAQQ